MRLARHYLLALALVAASGCRSRPASPLAGARAQPAPASSTARDAATSEAASPRPDRAPSAALGLGQRSPATLEIGPWTGRVIERHTEFVRYRFEAPGEASVIVELSPRREGHSQRFGTEEIAVQPGPGEEADPALLDAISEWLRTDEPGSDASFGVVGDQTGASLDDPQLMASPLIRSIGEALLGLWLLAALAALAARALDRRRARAREREAALGPARIGPARIGPALAMLALALLVAAAAIALRLALAGPSPLDADALRDLGAGSSCTLGPCPEGARASFGEIKHGTMFPRAIGWCLELGLGPRGIRVVLTALSGLAVGLCFDAGRRLGGEELGVHVGVLAAAGELGLLLAELGVTGEVAWNPAIVALPAALTQAALLRGAATGRPGPFLVAHLAAGLAFEAHVSGLALWPGLVIVTMAAVRRRPNEVESTRTAELGHHLISRLIWPLSWLPALAGALALPMILSPRSAFSLGDFILTELGLAGLVAAAALCLGLGLGLRRWVTKIDDKAAARATTLALALPLVTLLGALYVAADVVESRPIRYFAQVFPALALSGAWLSGAGPQLPRPRLRATATASLAALALALTIPPYVARVTRDRARWNYADVEAIAEVLRAHDVRRDEVHLAVRGALCGQRSHGEEGQRLDEALLGALRAFGALSPEPRSDDAPVPVWFVAKLHNRELSQPSEDTVTLASGAHHSVVMVPYEPLLDLSEIRHCVHFDDEDARCVAAEPRPVNIFGRQILPRHEQLLDRGEHGELAAFYYEIPLRGGQDGRQATLWLSSVRDRSPWRFVNADDTNTTALPASEVVVRVGPDGQATLTLARELDGEGLRHAWWPPLVELPDDPALRELFID